MAPKRGSAKPSARGGRNGVKIKPEPGPASAEAGAANEAPTAVASVASEVAPVPGRLPNDSSYSAPVRGRGTARPRAGVRRSQTARAEAERKAAEEKARETREAQAREAKARREFRKDDGPRGGADDRGGRGRGGRGGRSRGGWMGDHNKPITMASGPFSAGNVTANDRLGRTSTVYPGGTYLGGGGGAKSGTSGGLAGSSSTTARGGVSNIKREEGTDVDVDSLARQAQQTGGYVSSDAEDDDLKVVEKKNIDNLVIDLTGPDDEDPSHYYAPIRLRQQPHRDRTVQFQIDGAASAEAVSQEIADESGAGWSDKKKGKQRIKEEDAPSNTERFQGVYSSSEDEEEKTTVLPRLGDINDSDAGRPTTAKRKPKESNRSGTRTAPRPPKPVFQTAEEAGEWEICQRELETLHVELGSIVGATDQDGDKEMGGTDGEIPDRRADNVYLFQFPPMLPQLETSGINHREGSTASDDGRETAGTTTVAQEDGAVNELRPGEGSQAKVQASGAVGKLRVHKSGKAVLSWGGIDMIVSMGTQNSFLENVLVCSVPAEVKNESGEDVNEGNDGKVMLQPMAANMGRVKGKFVVTPDWEAILR